MSPSARIVALFAVVAFACRARDVSEATPAARSALAVEYRVMPPPDGCGPVRAPVVFLPALGFTGHSFAAVASNMASCRARILVNLPALEQFSSTRVIDSIAGVIADQSDEPVILVGHSLGGAIATRLAARHPERVAALVLVDAAVTPFDLSWWERLALRPRLWAPALRVFGQPAVFKHLLPEEICDWDAIDDFDLRKLAYQLGDPGQRRILLDYYQAFLSPSELQQTELALGRVRAPVLILWGRRDGVVPSTVVAAIRGAIAPAVPVDVRWFPQAAHLLPMERPEAVARALDDLDRQLASNLPVP
jgi:pimeloyl-ACP methyl ester carboxylesterase